MKKFFTILLVVLSFNITYSQSWKYKTFNSDFDGSYKLARVYGTGGEFPYKNPDLVVIRYSTGSVNIYISDAGYSGCDNKNVSFKFNNDEKIYTTSSVGGGANNDSWFIYSMEDISRNELLEKFTKHNYVSVRLSQDCGLKDYRFSLSGSTKALNYVLGYGWIKKQIEKEKKRKELLRKEDSIVREFKRKEDSIWRAKKNKKLREKRLKDSISVVIRKERTKQNRLKCRKLLSEFSGINYECYDFNGKEVRRKMQDPDSSIKVKEGTVLIIDNEFKNRAFYKICLIDGLSKFTSYAFKKDLEKTR